MHTGTDYSRATEKGFSGIKERLCKLCIREGNRTVCWRNEEKQNRDDGEFTPLQEPPRKSGKRVCRWTNTHTQLTEHIYSYSVTNYIVTYVGRGCTISAMVNIIMIVTLARISRF